MSEFHVDVVRLGEVRKHPDADALSITDVFGGYPCIIRTGDFVEGDLAVYVPVDSVVDTSRDQFKFLSPRARSDGTSRVKAMRLRGVFSMGLLVRPPDGAVEGENVADALGVTRYEPPEERMARGGFNARPPADTTIPVYTDIEPGRKYSKKVLVDGEEVVATEKLHGQNFRCYLDETGELHVGSHYYFKSPPGPLVRDGEAVVDGEGRAVIVPPTSWWKAALDASLRERLKGCADLALYGEVVGTQDIRYGVPSGDVELYAFDVLNTSTGVYLDYDEFVEFCDSRGIKRVPELYRGPWSEDAVLPLMEGRTTVPGADHVREGVVVRPVRERFDEKVGRVVLKFVGEGYHMRGDGKKRE